MTTPNTNGEAVNGDAVAPGTDSVMALHDPVMAEMNDPVMLSADGTSATLPGRSGSDSVQAMHDMLWREHAEPRDGFEPVPFWVSVVFGALLAWGGYYIGSNSADFRRDVYDRSDLSGAEGGAVAAAPDPDPQSLEDLMKIGQQKYQSICVACHLADGKGKPGENVPPLDGSEWLTAEDKASAARLSRIVLYGLSGPIDVLGKQYKGAVMPNQGNVLKDYEIASVLTYVRNSWSNKADAGKPPLVTTASVRAARAKEGPRKTNGTQPVTQDELLKLPVGYKDGADVGGAAVEGKK